MTIKYHIRKILKEETESEWIEMSPDEYKDLLPFVNYDGSLIKRIPNYRNKKIKINGNLKIDDKNVTNIDSIDYVDGSLDISYSGIEYFDKNKVKGNLSYYNSKMYQIEQKRILQSKYDDLEQLRKEDAWNVNNNKEVSEKTEALYKHLRSEGHVDETEIDGKEVEEDKYFIYPYNEVYFEWLGTNLFQSEWKVIADDEIFEYAKQYIEDLVDDVGLDAFRDYVWENALDENKVKDYYYDYFEEIVREEPEDYGVKKSLSKEQEKYIKTFETKIQKLKSRIQNESLSDEQINELEDDISGAEEIIEDIRENPQGYYDEDSIEEAIENLAEDSADNFLDHIKEVGHESDFLLDYIDMDELTDYVVRHDGYGHLLNGYDGLDDEYEVNGKWYHVMRHN
jgi:hypothetical protein